MTALTVGSLFSGIGGFDLGLERAGMRVAWQCESEPYARRVLAHHWPDVPCYEDIRAVRGEEVKHVDVLCGGFPCQDISLAGGGAGIAGSRSGLWSEYARLIGELRPRYVLVENVPSLRSRGLGVVLADLAARGYDAEWDGISARAVGARHQRDRIWIVAYPIGARLERPRREHGLRPAGGAFAEPAKSDRRSGELDMGGMADGVSARVDDVAAAVVADAESIGVGAGFRENESSTVRGRRSGDTRRPDNPWAIEPDVGRVAYGVPDRVDRLRCLGNALVPQIAEWIGRRIVTYEDAA